MVGKVCLNFLIVDKIAAGLRPFAVTCLCLSLSLDICAYISVSALLCHLKGHTQHELLSGSSKPVNFVLFFFLVEVKREVPVFRMNYNSLYIQHLKYILFCCTLVSKCIQVGFTEI